MAPTTKLKNLKAIGDMLQGNHFTQTRKSFYFGDAAASAERNKKRAVGEWWNEYDEHGEVKCVWEQRPGFRMRHPAGWSKEAEQREEEERKLGDPLFRNCYQDKCKTTPKTRLDRRFGMKMNMCADCVFKMESKLKMEGKFEQYEREKMLANANSFFKDADTEIEIVANALDTTNPEFTYSDGRSEKWSGGVNEGQRLKDEYNQFKQIALEQLEKYGQESTPE